MNFYFSNGVDRKTMFKNRVKASMLAMAVSAAVPIIIDVAINIYCVGRPLYVIYHAFFRLFGIFCVYAGWLFTDVNFYGTMQYYC
ncbi:MAG: hypothetical protein LUG95_02810 [Clostridiales bacterium]|nr:hypothetical protein [Clostridiales bacterium]